MYSIAQFLTLTTSGTVFCSLFCGNENPESLDEHGAFLISQTLLSVLSTLFTGVLRVVVMSFNADKTSELVLVSLSFVMLCSHGFLHKCGAETGCPCELLPDEEEPILADDLENSLAVAVVEKLRDLVVAACFKTGVVFLVPFRSCNVRRSAEAGGN